MIGGKKTGPMTRVDFGVEAATGKISARSQVWKEGMEEWCAASEVPDLAPLFKIKKKEFVPSSQKQAPPPPKKTDKKGAGMNDFDTAHFKLADLAPEDQGNSRQMEFDTAHFRLGDLPPEDSGQNRILEFDTAHFKLADLGQQPAQDAPRKRFRVSPAEGKPIIQSKLKQASTDAVPGKAPPPAPTPPPAANPAGRGPEWSPNSTVVDFRTLGELVHK